MKLVKIPDTDCYVDVHTVHSVSRIIEDLGERIVVHSEFGEIILATLYKEEKEFEEAITALVYFLNDEARDR